MTKGTEDVEAKASEACTRAGAFALLLSLALASLLPAWIHRRDQVFLDRYLTLRLNLAAAIQSLDENPLWQEYKQSHDTESTPIERLATLRINSTTLASVDSEPAQSKSEPSNRNAPDQAAIAGTGSQSAKVNSSHASSPRTQPPTSLGFVVGFDEIRQVALYLTQLNESDLLTRSRDASDFFNVSIYRWVRRRDNLVARTLLKSPSRIVTPNGWEEPDLPPNFTGAADKKALLGLTVGAVRELSAAELPPLSNTVRLGPDSNEVELNPSSFPRSLYGASLFAQVLLFFVIVYFNAFSRQATSAEPFPSQGTIFGAFAGSRSTLATFFFALWTPVAVSAGILALSFRATSLSGSLGLVACTALIAHAVFSIFATLNSKSYFRPLLRHGPAVPR